MTTHNHQEMRFDYRVKRIGLCVGNRSLPKLAPLSAWVYLVSTYPCGVIKDGVNVCVVSRAGKLVFHRAACNADAYCDKISVCLSVRLSVRLSHA